MNIIIKKMETAEETRGKAFVAWRAWHEAYPGLIAQDYLDSVTLEKCEDAAFRWPDRMLVAKDGDRVVGFIGYGTRAETPETGEVFALYVLSEYYGKGVGRKLMDAVLEDLSGYASVVLWVLKENGRARRFYQKCGFCPDGEEIFSPKHGAAEIRMALKRSIPVC